MKISKIVLVSFLLSFVLMPMTASAGFSNRFSGQLCTNARVALNAAHAQAVVNASTLPKTAALKAKITATSNIIADSSNILSASYCKGY